MASATLSACSPPDTMSRSRVDNPFGQAPVEDLARSRRLGIHQDRPGAVLVDAAHVAVPGREGLDHEGDALGHPTGVLGRLVSMELGGAQPDAVDDLDHAHPCFVAEHAYRQDLGRHALDDAPHRLGGHLARSRERR